MSVITPELVVNGLVLPDPDSRHLLEHPLPAEALQPVDLQLRIPHVAQALGGDVHLLATQTKQRRARGGEETFSSSLFCTVVTMSLRYLFLLPPYLSVHNGARGTEEKQLAFFSAQQEDKVRTRTIMYYTLASYSGRRPPPPPPHKQKKQEKKKKN